MRKKFQWEWEQINIFSTVDGTEVMTCRAKVFGGWIVKTIVAHRKHGLSSSDIFIQDKDHEWIIIEPQKEKIEPEKKIDASEYAPLPTIT